jgi:hypothetical protein
MVLVFKFRGRVARQVRDLVSKHYSGVFLPLCERAALLSQPTFHLAAGYGSRVYEFVNYGKRAAGRYR